MAGALMQLHQGVRPIGSAGGTGGQFPCHGGDPGLTRVHPYGQQSIISSPCHFILCLHQEKNNIMTEFLSSPKP